LNVVLYCRWSLDFAPMRADIFSRSKELTTMHEMGVTVRFFVRQATRVDIE